MRFKGVRDVERMESRLEEMKVGEYRIFIKLPLLRRSNGTVLKQDAEKVVQKDSHISPAWKTLVPPTVRGGKSYLGVLVDTARKPGNIENIERPKHVLVEAVKDEELHWLDRCAVGNVKNANIFVDLPLLLKDGGFLATYA